MVLNISFIDKAVLNLKKKCCELFHDVDEDVELLHHVDVQYDRCI